MKRFGGGPMSIGRAVVALAAVLWPAAALIAQVAPANSTAPADTIGPRELRNFSLGATAAPQAQTAPPDLLNPPSPSTNRTPRPAPRETPPPGSRATATPPTAPSSAGTSPPTRQGASVAPATTPPVTQGAARSVTIALPPADPLSRRATPANDADMPSLSSQPIDSAPPPSSAPLPNDDIGSLLPWLIAVLLLAGGAIAYALRGRLRPTRTAEPALAGGPLALPRELPKREFPPAPPARPEPRPDATPRMAAPPGGITVKRPSPFPAGQPAPAPPTGAPPTGIVSTRLRPWLEIAFEPSSAVIDEAQASVQFDIIVTNSGNAPARQVLIEACMINAGPDQDAELRRFIDQPVGAGDRINVIPPLGKIALKSAVALPLNQLRAYEVRGRRLFVPLIGFNALYEWGSNKGQSSAGFILGRATSAADGEGETDGRMAPLRLDLGPRVFRGLDSRRHPLAMRR